MNAKIFKYIVLMAVSAVALSCGREAPPPKVAPQTSHEPVANFQVDAVTDTLTVVPRWQTGPVARQKSNLRIEMISELTHSLADKGSLNIILIIRMKCCQTPVEDFQKSADSTKAVFYFDGILMRAPGTYTFDLFVFEGEKFLRKLSFDQDV